MENAESILVIFLSSFLALFLILGCIALVKIIQIVNHLKVITEKAEKLTDSVEHIGEFFRKSAGPVAIAKLLTNINDHVFGKRGSRRRRDDDEE